VVTKVAPTRGNMRQIKKSMALAVKGHDLLEQKRKILTAELLSRIGEVTELKTKIQQIFETGYQSLQMANIAMGVEQVGRIAEAVPLREDFVVRVRSVMGVELPQMDPLSPDVKPSFSFGGSTPSLDNAYMHAHEVLVLVARLAELVTSVMRLALQIRRTGRRVNALEKVTIPFQVRTIREISSILDENEREDLVRMKLSKKA
jgi:V/A-type H+-transporting ATPase subunit D